MKAILFCTTVALIAISAPGAAANALPADLPSGGSAVYVDQIGDNNRAEVIQTVSAGVAKIEQDGSSNQGKIVQSGEGDASATLSQSGTANLGHVGQYGSGTNLLSLKQSGSGNFALVDQRALGALANSAQLGQLGNSNAIVLNQEGSDNLALLSQEGDNNVMTATQVGEANRLSWTQQGDNLSDLLITQTGGSQPGGQLTIVQTAGGTAN